MEFWPSFWGVVLALSLVVFLVLAVVVAIGGLRDIRSLFASIDAQHGARDSEGGDVDRGHPDR